MNEIIFCNQVPEVELGYLAIIDGKLNQKGETFLRNIWDELNFPKTQKYNWDAYLDWMRDLSWIKSSIISIAILNYDLFLKDEPEMKKYFLKDIKEVVFSFWKEDAEFVFLNQPEYLKEIHVYCLTN